MPELPEIERYKNYINSKVLDSNITDLVILDKEVIDVPEKQDIKDILLNSSIENIDRIGKYLVLSITNSFCLEWHFGMTGLPYIFEKGSNPDYSRVIIIFESGIKLAFIDARKFGKMRIVKNQAEVIENHQLGADALSISQSKFIDAFESSTAMVKTGLMNQSMICGIGNLYSDEILFQAKLYPKTQFKDLNKDKLAALHSKTISVLKTAINVLQKHPISEHYTMSGKEFPDSFLIRHRKNGNQCPQCGEKIATMKLGGRTCYYCPKCQKKE